MASSCAEYLRLTEKGDVEEMKRRILLTVVAVICLIAGFSSGVWLAMSSRKSELLAAYSETAPATPLHIPVSDPSETDSMTAMLSAVKIPNSLERAAKLYEAIGGIRADQIEAMMNGVDRLPAEFQNAMREALFTRWLELDGESAKRWVRPRMRRAIANGSWNGDRLVQVWLHANPREAFAEGIRPPTTKNSGRFLSTTALLITNGDHRAALAELRAITDSALHDGAVAELFTTWGDKNPAEAFAQLDALQDSKLRAFKASEVLGKLARKDSALATQHANLLLQSLTPEQAKNVVERVAGMGGKDVASWALTLGEPFRKTALTGVFQGWFNKGDPIAAIEWVKKENLDSVIGFSAVWNQSVLSSKGLFDRILALPPSPLRSDLMGQLSHNMTADNLQQLRSSQLEVDRERATMITASHEINRAKTAQQAIAVLDTLSTQKNRVSMSQSIGELFAWRYPETAVTAIEAITDPALRDAAFSAAGKTLYEKHPAQAEDAFLKISDPDLRDQAKANVFRSGVFYGSPAKAEQWLEQSGMSDEWKTVLRAELRER